MLFSGKTKERNESMDHSILSTLDLVIIGVYLVSMVSIGLYFVRRIKG